MSGLESFYNNKKILVTGGTGYLGSFLVRELRHLGGKVIVGTSDIKKEDLKNQIIFLDYSNLENIKKILSGIDVVFHLASQTSAYVAEKDPGLDVERNVVSLVRLLQSIREVGSFPRFVFASTVTIFGLQTSEVFTEESRNLPSTMYDINKLIGESYVKYFSQVGIIKGCSLRLSNVYGVGITEGSSDRGVINKMASMALAGNELSIFGDGKYKRDYIYNEDVVSAFLHAGMSCTDEKGDYFNVCSGVGTKFEDVVDLIVEMAGVKTGQKPSVVYRDFPENALPIERRSFTGDNSKLKTASGWKVVTSLKLGIEKVMGIEL